ncbi:MAG: hypothetical protein AAF958_17250 [Planctomycetota bacterium]
MSRLSQIAALLVLITPLFAVGCGDEGNTVIQPGEDYQLTPAEQAQKDAEMKARMEGGEGE